MHKSEGAVLRKITQGPKLYHYTIAPPVSRATIGILHGYGEHAKRYAHVQELWAQQGLASIAMDMRGHGHAEGARGACYRFQDYHDDVTELSELTRLFAPSASPFLFGHSFGGLVAISSILDQPHAWKGLILSNPYLRLALDVPWLKQKAGKLLSQIAPWMGLRERNLTSDMLTRDPEKISAHDADPLIVGKINARWFAESQVAQQRIFTQAPQIEIPLYLVLGGRDKVASPISSRLFYQRIASKNKELQEEPSLLHEVLNEPEWRSIANNIASWILKQI